MQQPRQDMVRTCLMKNALTKLEIPISDKVLFTELQVLPMMIFFLSKGAISQASVA